MNESINNQSVVALMNEEEQAKLEKGGNDKK